MIEVLPPILEPVMPEAAPAERNESATDTEVAAFALHHGIGLIHEFAPLAECCQLGEFFASHLNDEDTAGVPLEVEQDHSLLLNNDFDEEPTVVPHAMHQTLQRLADRFRSAIQSATGTSDVEGVDVTFEVLRYTTTGMGWHTDNYMEETGDPRLNAMRAMNGVMTLLGQAEYAYIDPITEDELGLIPVSDGDLVISRSGDIGDLLQVEHMVSAPKGPEGRVVLLMSLTGPGNTVV